jgi:hypothetical protein
MRFMVWALLLAGCSQSEKPEIKVTNVQRIPYLPFSNELYGAAVVRVATTLTPTESDRVEHDLRNILDDRSWDDHIKSVPDVGLKNGKPFPNRITMIQEVCVPTGQYLCAWLNQARWIDSSKPERRCRVETFPFVLETPKKEEDRELRWTAEDQRKLKEAVERVNNEVTL